LGMRSMHVARDAGSYGSREAAYDAGASER
jgi:hypothetical protein